MKAWTDRVGVLGDKLVDGGNPISNVKTIAPGRVGQRWSRRTGAVRLQRHQGRQPR